MTIWFRQFWLLFTKNLLWKRRQPVSLVLELIWPISVFLIVVLIKQHPDINPERHTTCYYRARALPSAGLLPFIQSFVCNIDNECLTAEQNEAIPEYKDSQLYQIADELQPLLSSEAIVEFIRQLPATLKIFEAAGTIVDNETLLEHLTHDLPLRDLMKNTQTLQKILVEQHEILDEQTFMEILSTGSVNLTHVILDIFGQNASNLHHVICNNRATNTLDNEDMNGARQAQPTLADMLCHMPRENVLHFVDKLHENLNVEKLIDFLLMTPTASAVLEKPAEEFVNETDAEKPTNIAENEKQLQIVSDVQSLLPSVREVLLKIRKFKQNAATTDDSAVTGDKVNSFRQFNPARWQNFLSKLYGHLLHADRRFGITAGNYGDNGRVWYGGLLKTMNSLTEATATSADEHLDFYSNAADDVTTSASVTVLTRTRMPSGKSWNSTSASRSAIEEELWRRRFVSFIRHHPLSPFYAPPATNEKKPSAAAFFDPKNSLSSMIASSFGREKVRLKGKPFPSFEQFLRMMTVNDDFIIVDKQSVRLRNFLCEHREQVRNLAGDNEEGQPTASMSNVETILNNKCSLPRMKRSASISSALGEKQAADFFASEAPGSAVQDKPTFSQQLLNSAAGLLNEMLPDERTDSSSFLTTFDKTIKHPFAQQVLDAASKTLTAKSRTFLTSAAKTHDGNEMLNRFNGLLSDGGNQPTAESFAAGDAKNPQALSNLGPDLRASLCTGFDAVRQTLDARRSPNFADEANYWELIASGLCPPTTPAAKQLPVMRQQDILSNFASRPVQNVLSSISNQFGLLGSDSNLQQPLLENVVRTGISALSDFVRGGGGNVGEFNHNGLRPAGGGLWDALAGRRNADAIDVAAVWLPNSIKQPNLPFVNDLLIKVATVLLRGVNDRLEAISTTNEFLFDLSLFPQLNTIAQLIQAQYSELAQIFLWTYTVDSTKLFRLFQSGFHHEQFFQDFCRNPNYFFTQPPALAQINALERIAQHLCTNIVPPLLTNELFSFFDYNFITRASTLLLSADSVNEPASFSQLMNEIRHFVTSVNTLLNKLQQRKMFVNVLQASASQNADVPRDGRWKRDLSRMSNEISTYRSSPEALLNVAAQTLHAFSPPKTAHAISLLAAHGARWLNDLLADDFARFNFSDIPLQHLAADRFPTIAQLLDIVDDHWEPLLRAIIYTSAIDNVRLMPLYLSLVDGGLNGSSAAICRNGTNGIDEAMESFRMPINLFWNNHEFWQRLCAIDRAKLSDETYAFGGGQRIEQLKTDWINLVTSDRIGERIDFDALRRTVKSIINTIQNNLLHRHRPLFSNPWLKNDLWNQLWLDVHQDIMDYIQSVPLSSFLTDIIIDRIAESFLYWQQRWRSGYSAQGFADVEAALNASESVMSFSTRRLAPLGFVNVTINELVQPQLYQSLNGFIKFLFVDSGDFIRIVQETIKTDPQRTSHLISLLLSRPLRNVRAKLDELCARPLEFFVESAANRSTLSIMSDICSLTDNTTILWNLTSDVAEYFWPEQLRNALLTLTNGTTWANERDNHQRSKRDQTYEPNLFDMANYVQNVELLKRAVGNVGFAHELPRFTLPKGLDSFSAEEFEETGSFVMSSMLLEYLSSKLRNSSYDPHFIADALDAVVNDTETFLHSPERTDGDELIQILSNLTTYNRFMRTVHNAIHTAIQTYANHTDLPDGGAVGTNGDENRTHLSTALNRAVKLVTPHIVSFMRQLLNDSSLLEKIVRVQAISQLTDVIGGGIDDELHIVMLRDNQTLRDSHAFSASARLAVMEWLMKRMALVLDSGMASAFLPDAREMTDSVLSLLSAEGIAELSYIVKENDDLLLHPSQTALTTAVCGDERANSYRIPPANTTLCDYAQMSNSSLVYPNVVRALGLAELVKQLNEYYALGRDSSATETIDDEMAQNPQLIAAGSSWFTKIAPQFDWSKLYDVQAVFSETVGQLVNSLRAGRVKFDLLQYFSEWIMDHLTSFPNMSYECNKIILPRLDALPTQTRARTYAYLDIGQVAARIVRNILNKIEPLPMHSACWRDPSSNASSATPLVSVETFLYEIVEQLEIERIVVDSLDLYGNAAFAAQMNFENSTDENNATFSTAPPLPLFNCFQALQDVVQIARSMGHILLQPQQQQSQSRLSQLFTTCLERVDFPTFASHLADLSGILQAAMNIVREPAFRRLSQQMGGNPAIVVNAVAAIDSLNARIKRDVSAEQEAMPALSPLTELVDSLNQIFPDASSSSFSVLPKKRSAAELRNNKEVASSSPLETVQPLKEIFLGDLVKNDEELRTIHPALSDAILPVKLEHVKKWFVSSLQNSSLSPSLCDNLDKLSAAVKIPKTYFSQLSSAFCNDLSADQTRQVLVALAENIRISSMFAERSSIVSNLLAKRTNMTAEEVRENVRNTFETSRQFIPAAVRAIRRAHLNLTEIVHSYQNATSSHDTSTNQLLQFVLSTTGKFLCGHNFADVLSDLKMVASFGSAFDDKPSGERHGRGEDDDEESSMSASHHHHVAQQQPGIVLLSTIAERKSWSPKPTFSFRAWDSIATSGLRDNVFDQAHYDKFLNSSLNPTGALNSKHGGEISSDWDFSIVDKTKTTPTSFGPDETTRASARALNQADYRQKKASGEERQIRAEMRRRGALDDSEEEFFEDPFTAASSFQSVTRNPASFSTAASTTRRRVGGDIILQFPVRLPGSSFRNEFCTKIFHGLSQMPGGSIMWSYLKPLLRGRIVFYPDTREAWAIMQQANSTFEQLGRAAHLLRTFANSSHMLHTVERHMVDPLLYSRFVSQFVHGMYASSSNSNDDDEARNALNTSRDEIKTAFDELFRGSQANAKDLIDRVADFARQTADFIECINLEHRFEAVKTKTSLQKRARELAEDKELLAAVSFLNLYKQQRSPSMPLQLPRHVKYEIQMDIDNVPFTHRIKDYFYVPGPRDNFLDDMRYFRGFIQLQDTIDRAIIKLQTQLHPPPAAANTPPLPATYLQQMPYPCYQFDLFNHVVYSTLPMQVILAWIYMIALSIRNMVFERESGLERLMTVHGMRGGVQWVSSCLVTYLTMSVISTIVLCILKLGGVFAASSFGVLFYIFQLFSLSSIAMSYMVAAFFTRSTVAALTGVIVYLISYLPFIVIVALEANLHFAVKVLCCMSSTTAFSFALFYANRVEESGVGVQWSNIGHSSISSSDDWNVQYACYMLMFDTVLYFTVGFYVRAVMQQMGGNSAWICHWVWKVPRALSRLWTQRRKRTAMFPSESAYYHYNAYSSRSRSSNGVSEENSPADESSRSNRNKVAGIVCIGLTKIFRTSSFLGRRAKSTTAVDNFTMSFYESEITSLLGHNGAGKSTTINMICGFAKPTSGASFIYGYNANQQKNFRALANAHGQQHGGVGVCPQQNVLFSFMTVREHLEFYCKLKSGLCFSRVQIVRDVDGILHQLELWDAQTERAVNLSGGMKRRLMVAIAFCAGSRVVVLDEPTSGVDPVARRQIWDLIVRLKHGRTILLTTHHLDEADILSDRIVIIHQGKLQCCGSPLYLKTQFGSGYQLTMTLKPDTDEHNIEQARQTHNVDTLSSCGSNLLDLLASTNERFYHDSPTDVSSAEVTLEFWQKQTTTSPVSHKLDANNALMTEITSPDQFSLGEIILSSNPRDKTTRKHTIDSKPGVTSTQNETRFLATHNEANTPVHNPSLQDRLQLLDRLIITNVRHTQRVDTSAHHVTYLLPFSGGVSTDSSNNRSEIMADMVRLLQQLHLQREQLGLITFGLTSPSMEDVFLNITTCVDRGINVALIPPMAAAHLARNAFVSRRSSNCSSTSSSRRSSTEHEMPPPTTVGKTGQANFPYSYSTLNRRASMDEDDAPRRRDCRKRYTLARCLIHMRALLRKRLYHNMRNTKTLLSTLCLPILFIFVAMSFSFLRPSHNDYPALQLHAGLYGPESRMFLTTPKRKPITEHDVMTTKQAKQIAEKLKLLQSSVVCGSGRSPFVDSDPRNDEFDVENSRTRMCFAKPKFILGNSNVTEKGSMTSVCHCDEHFVYQCDGVKDTSRSLHFTPDIYVLNNVTRDMLYDLTGHNIESWLLRTTNDNDFAESRYGGWSLGHSMTKIPYYSSMDSNGRAKASPAAAKVWYNNRGFHAMTAYLNGLNNALLRYAMSSAAYRITTYNHPLNLTATQLSRYTILQNVSDVGVALVILTGFSFIPAAAIVFLVVERVSEEKQLQMISGVRPWLYWLVAFIWDYFFVYLLSVPLVAVVLYAFQIDMYYAGYNFAAILSLIGLFGFACLPMLYIASRLFEDASFAYTVLFCGNVFVGMLSVTTTTTLSFFYFVPDLARLHWICETLFLTFLPQFCLGSGLVETVKAHIRSRIAQRLWCDGAKAAVSPALVPACRTHFTLDPFRWDVMGNRLLAMAIQGVVFFIINLMIEYVSWNWLLGKVRSMRPTKTSAATKILPEADTSSADDDGQEDTDVVEERLRVLCGKACTDALQINSLSKIYSSGAGSEHLAVDRLSFGVRRGECFGLLGFNGAGKTTTFRMLAGQLSPTSGAAIVNNTNTLNKSSVYTLDGLLGYCPQTDALDMLLTVHETLMVHAELRGITPYSERVRQVQKLMRTLQLLTYKNVRNANLSGGNKRKVCVAIAMLGNPKLILMDEPTSGMDPGTRRLVWEVVPTAVRQGRSVILTSHSMEECDALCSRLGIMLNGRLSTDKLRSHTHVSQAKFRMPVFFILATECIGTPVHLKNKFGRGYVCSIRMSSAHFHPEKLLTFMQAKFGGRCSLRQQHHQAFDFIIAANDSDLAHVFQVLEQARVELRLEDYAVSQCTLDQVFVEIASQQAEDLRDRVQSVLLVTANVTGDTEDVDAGSGTIAVAGQESSKPSLLVDLSYPPNPDESNHVYYSDDECLHDVQSAGDHDRTPPLAEEKNLHNFPPPPYLRLVTTTPVNATMVGARHKKPTSPDIDLFKGFSHV